MKNTSFFFIFMDISSFRKMFLMVIMVFSINSLEAQTWTAPTMDQFMGINIIIDRADFAKASKFKTVRVFHDWPSDVGVKDATVGFKCPLNPHPGNPDVSQKLSWSYSFNTNRAIDFLDVYRRFNASPVFNRPSPEFFGQTLDAQPLLTADYRPVCNNGTSSTPTSPTPIYTPQPLPPAIPQAILPARYYDQAVDYLQYTKWVSLFAAQFGYKQYSPSGPLGTKFLNHHVKNFKYGSTSFRPTVKYMEVWNEADKFWKDHDIIGAFDPANTTAIEDLKPTYACFRPWEYAAMLSAAYDGHGYTMKVEGTLENQPQLYPLGIKNMGTFYDPFLHETREVKVVFTGLADFRHNYVKKTIDAMYTPINQGGVGRAMDNPVPFDVLNFHHYSSSDAPFGKLGFSDGYNYAGVAGSTIGVHPEAEAELLKKRVGLLIKELENTSTSAKKTFNLDAKEIWVSEFGYDTYTGTEAITGLELPSALNGGDVFKTQGQWLVRSYLELAAARTSGKKRGLDKAFAYKLNDDPNQGNYQFGYCGILDATNHPKQSWYYIRTLQNVLRGFSFLSDQIGATFSPDANNPNLPQLKAYLFNKGNKTPTLVVWSGSANTTPNGNAFQSTGTLEFSSLSDLFPTLLTDFNFPSEFNIATKTTIVVPDENGRRESITVNGRKIPNLTISETPIFIELGVNTPDNKVEPVKLKPIDVCNCSGVKLMWDIPEGTTYRYYRVYYKQFCGNQPTGNDLNLDINTWTIYAEQLQGSQDEITISGLKDCIDPSEDAWYAFHVVPIGGIASSGNEVLPTVKYDETQAVVYQFDAENPCEKYENCILNPSEYTLSANDSYIKSVRGILDPGTQECSIINLTPTQAFQQNPWIGSSYGNDFTINFNTPQRINSIHLLVFGLGRLRLQYYDACAECWRYLPPIEYYQNTNQIWTILTGAQLPKVPISKLRVIRSGLLGADGVPGDGLGFALHRFNICSTDEDCPRNEEDSRNPGKIDGLRAEQVEYDAVTLAWETALINSEIPNRGIFDWYEVRYSKEINEAGELINPIGEAQGIETSLNDAEVVYRITDLEPATTYHIEVTAADAPESQCRPSEANTRALLTLQTERVTKIGERSIENVKIQQANSIHIFPNPTTDWLTVHGNEFNFSKIEIVDGAGRILLRKNINQSNITRLNVVDLPSGLYHLRMIGASEVVVRPFVKP
jgi:hypothetical protein